MNASTLVRTNDAVRADRTSSGKEHFEVLDGLRGSAAFLIVIFHLFSYSFGWDIPLSLVRHAYLAVDFFFGLSGFVVAYAYDDRWIRMSILQFFRIRLIRLHPLVLLGATLGLLGYIFDPFGKAINHTPAPMLLLAYVTSLCCCLHHQSGAGTMTLRPSMGQHGHSCRSIWETSHTLSFFADSVPLPLGSFFRVGTASYLDEPVRVWLTRRYGIRRAAA